MRRLLAPIPLLVVVAGLLGCDRERLPTTQFTVQVDEQFKFTPTQFECRPGQVVRIQITNTIPVGGADIAHNMVLTHAGVDLEAFGQATFNANERQAYIPAAYAGQVIAKTPLIHPGETGELTFVAPSVPGSYPLLCTFPGHCILGMKAVLIVR